MANIDIYVIGNSSDVVTFVDSALTAGDIPIANVKDLVTQVSTKCAAGGDKIRELRIVGHGNHEGQWIGSDWVTSQTVDWHAAEWRKLRPFFSTSGLVTLGGCKVGQVSLLLVKLSNYLAVPVRGFRTFQNPAIPGDEGGETKCFYFNCTRQEKSFTIYNEEDLSPL